MSEQHEPSWVAALRLVDSWPRAIAVIAGSFALAWAFRGCMGV